MVILGISAFYHDSAAALLREGEIVAAAQEERFSRRKHDAAFPARAVEYCLREAGVALAEVDRIVFYDKPFLTFERLLESHHAFAPAGFRAFAHAMPAWLKEKLFLRRTLERELDRIEPGAAVGGRLHFCQHHLSHAASAFYPSPFEEALVVVIDGVGEWATTSVWRGRGERLEALEELHFPHSLGLLYSAFTSYCGFRVNDGEYKLMGLAPYGEPRYLDAIERHLIEVAPDGSFRLDMDYFGFGAGLTMTSRRFHRLFGGPPRRPDEPIEQRHMDLAASIQSLLERVVLRMAADLRRRHGMRRLCLAGGVALNCVANGRLARAEIFDELWIQPAAGDAGGALGAALALHHLREGAPRRPRPEDAMSGAALGPSFGEQEIEQALRAAALPFERLGQEQVVERAARELARGAIIGWFQGRMELGPRALGQRSILADPRGPKVQREITLRVRGWGSFRPFAPAILEERAQDYFEGLGDSPYMLKVAPLKARWRIEPEGGEAVGLDRVHQLRSLFPAVTHVDQSARVQTVSPRRSPLFHRLIRRFDTLTGCPMVLNTSFNRADEPIVCTPRQALESFVKSGLDALYIGPFRVGGTC